MHNTMEKENEKRSYCDKQRDALVVCVAWLPPIKHAHTIIVGQAVVWALLVGGCQKWEELGHTPWYGVP